MQTVDASRLMGAGVIVTGLSAEIAQTLVTIGVDLSKITTVGDLQGGIEEAERELGFQGEAVPMTPKPARPRPRNPCWSRSCGRAATSSRPSTPRWTTTQLVRFQHDLIDQVGRDRASGIIIDVAALDVVDSFAAHTLRNLAHMARLRGARTVIVGINPEVA